ncbi:MAG: hypothetical protein ACOCYV_03825, partial [Planctomycetota bacterium]
MTPDATAPTHRLVPIAASDDRRSMVTALVLGGSGRGARTYAGLTFAGIALVAGLLVLLVGYVPPTSHPWSSFILLDAGWRTANGQVAHVDFHSPVGFIYTGLLGALMRLGGAGPRALALLPLALLVPCALWVWWVSVRRFAPAAAVAVASMAILHLLAIGMFGMAGDAGLSYAGQYSRVAWAVFMVLALQAVVPPRVATARTRMIEWCIAGLAVAFLLGTKFTYGLAAVPLLGLGAWLQRDARPWLVPATAAVSCVVAFGLALVLTGSSVGAYLADLALVARSNQQNSLGLLRDEILEAPLLLATITLLCLLWLLPRSRSVDPLRGLGPVPGSWIAIALVTVLGLGLSATNGGEIASPVYPLLIALALGLVSAGSAAPAAALSARRSGALLAAVVIAAVCAGLAQPLLQVGAYRVRVGDDHAWHAATVSPTLDGTWFALVARPPVDADALYADLVQNRKTYHPLLFWYALRDGIALLDAHSDEPAVVASTDFINPFPFAMAWPSPRGDCLYWHYGRNVGPGLDLDPASVFAEVDLIMDPVRPIIARTCAFKWERYGSWLDAHFTHIATTQWWRLYARRSDVPAVSPPPAI